MSLSSGAVVLQVLPRLDSGGVERGTVEIVQAIASAGGVPLVASQGGRLVPDIARAGGRHITLPLASKNPLRMWRNAASLARLIEAERVALVHARSRAPAWSAWAAAQRTHARFVTTYHAPYDEGLPGKRAYNAVMARGERVIAISRYIERILVERHAVDPSRIRVIPRGVDPAVFDPARVSPDRMARLAAQWRLPDGVPTVVLPGRLSRWKGGEVLVEALALMHQRNAWAVLVGPLDGRSRIVRQIEQLAIAAGVADRLRFAGDCADMPAALMLADVVASPSTEPEGFGRVIIEAQAMARPVIATDHGGAAETIEHEITGWRVRPGDPAALAAALDTALALAPEQRAALGQRARAAVLARYTTAALQAATIAVYRELLGSRILVIKLGALGDFVLAFGPFASIRAHHEKAEITLLTTAPFAALARESPWFDRVLIDARPAWWDLAGLRRLRAALRGYDLVYDLQTSGRSGRYFRLAGKPRWSGIARGASHPHANPRRNRMHTVERQQDQLRAAGIARFPPPDLSWLTRLGPEIAAPYAVLVPGSAPHRLEKRWPAASFGALARLLQARGIRPVILGASGDSGLAAGIRSACPEALDLTGRTSLADLGGICARALVAIGNDTGPMHLAAAVGCPSLVLFSGASDPALTAPRGRVTVLRERHLADLAVARVASALP